MSRLHTQRGFSLMAALFMITAVLLVTAAMIGTTLSRSSSTVLGLRASQALYSARSALQIASAQVLAGGCAAVTATQQVEGFTVDLTCVATLVAEAGTTSSDYKLTARAYQGRLSDNSFVSRSVMLQLSNAP